MSSEEKPRECIAHRLHAVHGERLASLEAHQRHVSALVSSIDEKLDGISHDVHLLKHDVQRAGRISGGVWGAVASLVVTVIGGLILAQMVGGAG